MLISWEENRLVASRSENKPIRINGYARLVALFRTLDPVTRAKLLQKLVLASPVLARLVEVSDFTWWDLERLDNKSIQKVFSLIPEKDWLVAWKLAGSNFKELFLQNMSELRRTSFLQAFSEQPKVPKTQVYRVMFQISCKIRLMAMRGELVLLTRPRKSLKLNLAKEKK